MKLKQITSIFLGFCIIMLSAPQPVLALDSVRTIVFPVLGGAEYRDDYGEPRVGGRKHEGNDLMAEKMRSVLAAVDGEVSFLTKDEATWGWSLSIIDKDGYEYNYIHLNNDTPGTDDGSGGYNNAFAAGIKLGVKVKKGEVVGYLGDSGNAETTPPHLHFEIREAATGTPINPYQSLKNAKILSTPTASSKKKVRQTKKSKTQKEQTTKSKELKPFKDFSGGANLSAGNLDNDSDLELVVATGFNAGAETIVKTLNTDGKGVKEFSPFGKDFKGGADVASVDVNGDGSAEVIVGSGPARSADVNIFKASGELISNFTAYPKFSGGVRVAAADINGDGKIEIVTAPGSGGGPHVKIFNTDGKLLKEVMVYSPKFTGGVDVSAFAPSGSFPGGFVTAPGSGGGPHVKIYNFETKVVGEFMAYPASFSGGVKVDSGNFVQNNGSFEVLTVPASNSSGNTKLFKINGELLKTSSQSFEETWAGGFDAVMVGTKVYMTSSGGRPTTIKEFEL